MLSSDLCWKITREVLCAIFTLSAVAFIGQNANRESDSESESEANSEANSESKYYQTVNEFNKSRKE